MSSPLHNHVGFQIGTDLVGQQPRSVARFHCTRCPNTIAFTIGRGLSPDNMALRARRAGWLADARTRSRTRCPACAGSPPSSPVPDEDAPVAVAQMTKDRTPPAPAAPAPVPIEAARMTPRQMRPLTANERVAVRALLERHFDEGRGMYASGQSDQTIAEAAAVPRAFVEQIRDAAYGPIRVTPEMVKLRGDVAKAAGDLADLLTMAADMKRTVEGLTARIEKMERAHD